MTPTKVPAPHGNAANLLGALALAVCDRLAAMENASGLSATAAAALSALDQFLDRPSIDRLSAVVGLSQSGGVRLVDRLEGDHLVKRGSAPDGRMATVRLTPAGRRAARKAQAERMRMLQEALAPLDSDERALLAILLGRILVGQMRGPGATRWICRRCDLAACGRATGHCPVEREARARYGPPGAAP